MPRQLAIPRDDRGKQWPGVRLNPALPYQAFSEPVALGFLSDALTSVAVEYLRGTGQGRVSFDADSNLAQISCQISKLLLDSN